MALVCCQASRTSVVHHWRALEKPNNLHLWVMHTQHTIAAASLPVASPAASSPLPASQTTCPQHRHANSVCLGIVHYRLAHICGKQGRAEGTVPRVRACQGVAVRWLHMQAGAPRLVLDSACVEICSAMPCHVRQPGSPEAPPSGARALKKTRDLSTWPRVSAQVGVGSKHEHTWGAQKNALQRPSSPGSVPTGADATAKQGPGPGLTLAAALSTARMTISRA